jgi:hypothetical protein
VIPVEMVPSEAGGDTNVVLMCSGTRTVLSMQNDYRGPRPSPVDAPRPRA